MSEENELTTRKKQRCFEDGMRGDHVLVQLDARYSGVQVPKFLADNPALTLKMSYRFQGETTCDEQGISTYLKFDGDYFHCIIPWGAVWGINHGEGEGTVWPEDIPREVMVQLARAKLTEFSRRLFGKKAPQPNASQETNAQCPQTSSDGKLPDRKPTLTVATDPAKDATNKQPERETMTAEGAKRTDHLKRVK